MKIQCTEGRIDISKEMISECKDRIKTTQNETQLKKIIKNLKSLVSCATPLRSLIYV